MKTSQGTLFVVDDDPKSRKAVAALASSMKIRCETFASAEGFLDRYDPSLTGCALVDFRLGGMDGLQLQERLRAMGSTLCRGSDQRLCRRAHGRSRHEERRGGLYRKALQERRSGRRGPQSAGPQRDTCGSHAEQRATTVPGNIGHEVSSPHKG